MKRSRYCKGCKCQVAAEYQAPVLITHAALTVFTLGLWLPIGILVAMFGGHWACLRCGRSV